MYGLMESTLFLNFRHFVLITLILRTIFKKTKFKNKIKNSSFFLYTKNVAQIVCKHCEVQAIRNLNYVA